MVGVGVKVEQKNFPLIELSMKSKLSQSEADPTVECMVNAIYGALGRQITFESAAKIFENGKKKLSKSEA